MSRRGPKGKPELPDHHLWLKVRETVTPLRPDLVSAAPSVPEPLPIPAPGPKVPAMKPAQPVRVIAMPAYQSDGKPGKKPRAGIEPNLKQRLARGREEIDGTIDLHGMRQSEAHGALIRFIETRFARGDRTVLVITGKGLKKLEDDAAVLVERGVLRAMLPFWLTSPDLAPLVSGWDYAAQWHGGDGAFYVRLKRVRDYR